MNPHPFSGSLYLFPVTLGDSDPLQVLPAHNIALMNEISHFIAEDARTARRTLAACGVKNIREKEIIEFNKQTDKNEVVQEFLGLVKSGKSVGLMSEAGCPAVADPGSEIVNAAHLNNISVIPLTGPSSLLLALMASGMNGQHFTFHGYLPAKTDERAQKLKILEKDAYAQHVTHLFIETPYRNMQLLDSIIQHCRPATLLCIACDITLETEFIATKTVGEWKKKLPVLGKRPAVFLISEGY